ncbi:hypothetical protein NVP1086O_27 [Vibrio phage 1.086.O._10N.222.51.F8]|nr:hypothetical protein NVP1086O_27 [Vibrio phage 1.086.O._10N.222.51.F8]
MQLSINPTLKDARIVASGYFTISNCTFGGIYHHGTTVNGKRLISGWTKKFITKIKYKL